MVYIYARIGSDCEPTRRGYGSVYVQIGKRLLSNLLRQWALCKIYVLIHVKTRNFPGNVIFVASFENVLNAETHCVGIVNLIDVS